MPNPARDARSIAAAARFRETGSIAAVAKELHVAAPTARHLILAQMDFAEFESLKAGARLSRGPVSGPVLDEAIARIRQGHTVVEIGEELDLNLVTLRKALRRAFGANWATVGRESA